MVPRKDIIQSEGAAGIGGSVEAAFLKSIGPFPEIKALGPSVEAAAETRCLLDDPADAPVSPGKRAFEQTCLGIMRLEGDALSPEALFKIRLLSPDLLDRRLAHPLEGRMGLGHE